MQCVVLAEDVILTIVGTSEAANSWEAVVDHTDFTAIRWQPVMWETWSADGGQSWTPAHRGPFGTWASTTSMLSTTSGALLIAGRHPGLAFQLSYDDGMTWQCYRFDTTFWANGFTYEIEPDVVMYASTAKYSDPHVRVHLFRITPEGPEPVRYGETEQ